MLGHVRSFVGSVSGCDQSVPLGMISGRISDWQITSSSVYPVEWDGDCAERYARVYQADRLGWCAKYKSASEWLQVDLGVVSKVFRAGCTKVTLIYVSTVAPERI